MPPGTAKVFSKKQFHALGLELAGHPQWKAYKHHCNIERYRQAYGVTPKTAARLWHELRTSNNAQVKLPVDYEPIHLLLSIRFLWRYEVYEDLGRFFGIRSPKTVRKWVWDYLNRIRGVLRALIPDWMDAYNGLRFFFSIDGTHCAIQEPSPWSPIWSSHKLGGKPGLNYEIVLQIDKPRLLWIYGPSAPGAENDIKVFKTVLLQKLQQLTADHGVTFRGIGDKGYRGAPEFLSTRNDLDPPEISEFKNRVLARHESFNQKLKMFDVLSGVFRHDIELHPVCFESVGVLTCIQLQNKGLHLFDPYP
jgi:hypothetical protein